MIRIRILEFACFLKSSSTNKEYYMMHNNAHIIEYFFPEMQYILVDASEEADMCLTSVFMEDNSMLRNNEINVFISIENLTNKQFNWYNHYNTYGEFNDDKINLYIYSHIDKIIENANFLAIPCIYTRINYFKKTYGYYFNHTQLNTSFNEKKFCLMINKSGINPEITHIKNILNKIDTVDSIFDYHNINDKSCYNSLEFLEVLNKYKFIICFENSSNDGYITEKIFNCFFSKTIPIYWGSLKCKNYFNENSFLHYNDNLEELLIQINNLNNNQDLYDKYINNNKISDNYDDQNYSEKMLNFIEDCTKNKKAIINE
uniref:Fucosyltransferase C-terminal domain-containing protein n=1 Tax=viral metagenome TaxID=1070528 RepID=A0A6C0HQ30_9ZZZZ